MSETPFGLFFDTVLAEEIPLAHEIEVSGYPADEAASLESFVQRQFQAPDLFLGAYLPTSSALTSGDEQEQRRPDKRRLVGYVCATLSSSEVLTHESMSEHDPFGKSVCIHSVCVDESMRRKGVALALLKEYVTRLEQSAERYDRVLLIVHEGLRPFYEKAGFVWLGKSEVVHGALPWFDMRKELVSSPAASESTQQTLGLPPGLLDALQRSTSRIRPKPRHVSDFSGSKDIVSVIDGVETNRFDILCPRDNCGSIILKSGVGQLVEVDGVELEPTGSPIDSLFQRVSPSAKITCWLVQPNPMSFENIGFSKAVNVPDNHGPQKKFLSCADCDLGPVGWCFVGGSDYWLVVNRVGYR